MGSWGSANGNAGFGVLVKRGVGPMWERVERGSANVGDAKGMCG